MLAWDNGMDNQYKNSIRQTVLDLMNRTALQSLGVAVVVGYYTLFITGLTLLPNETASAQSCYLDNRGRIVTRRRPGYKSVECPAEDVAPAVDQPAVRKPSQPSDATPPVNKTPNKKPAAAEAAKPQIIKPAKTPLSTPSRRPVKKGFELGERKQSATSPGGERRRNTPSPIQKPTLADYKPSVPVRDRWRVMDQLGYKESLLDPYNRNPLKADKPLYDDWFFSLAVIADTIVETRKVPTPVGASSTANSGGSDVFGGDAQSLTAQILATELVYYKGNTVFKPPDYEFRLTAAFSYNNTELDEIQGVNADPRDGNTRQDEHLGIQAAFYDQHIRNVSDRYDFDSFRIGIQPFSSDFRGFLFQDNQFGARLFGTRDNNKWQYNLAWFRRIEKDTNSGLNDLGKGFRDDDIFVANLTRQDWPVLGFFSQLTALYNVNNEDEDFYFNNNEFIERPASLGRETPRGYDVLYLGYNGDGHIGRFNLTTSAYYAVGTVEPGVFVDSAVDVSAAFAAAELSVDYDWIRPRVSFIYASGDDDPFDDVATGFDAVFENPQIAGGETSYWNRQAVPLIAGGRVALSGRNSFLNALRSSKEEGQSNFTNPGLLLLGVGVDMDILPELRLSLNVNQLQFNSTAVLEAARNQAGISNDIGTDISAALIYRPWMSQNIVLRASYATLIPGQGFDDLFPNENAESFLFNATFNY